MTLRDPVAQGQPPAFVLDAGQRHPVSEPGRVDCAVVVVTYNSVRDISALLDSLPAAAAGLRIRTIVVDNGSTDGTVELVRSRPDVTCVEVPAILHRVHDGIPYGPHVDRSRSSSWIGGDAPGPIHRRRWGGLATTPEPSSVHTLPPF